MANSATQASRLGRKTAGWLELRRRERQLTFKTGRIVVENAAEPIECAILNVSDEGACLMVPEGGMPPDRFTLVIDGSDDVHACTVVWRETVLIGVSYD